MRIPSSITSAIARPDNGAVSPRRTPSGHVEDKVLLGELARVPVDYAELLRTARQASTRADRVAAATASHHALGNYLAGEAPLGILFDTYV